MKKMVIFNMKLARVPLWDAASKYLDNWDPIFQMFFSSVKEQFSIISAFSSNSSIQTACKLISASSKEAA